MSAVIKEFAYSMVIFWLSGGFGNQLFSFAAGYQLAKDRKETFAIDTSAQEAPWFFRNYDIGHYNIHYDKKICYPLGNRKIDHYLLNHVHRRKAIGLFTPTIKERYKYHYDPELFNTYFGTAYYVGFWQCPKYFSHYESDIREMFVYTGPLSKQADQLQKEISSNPNSVAVHARRGDYVKIGIALEPAFYRNAIERMAEQMENPVFYLFSEDPDWILNAVKDLPFQFRLMNYQSPDKGIEDFELMRSCKHQIISNSTYSWWAAWLNDNPNKIILRPSSGLSEDTSEFWPPEWQQL